MNRDKIRSGDYAKVRGIYRKGHDDNNLIRGVWDVVCRRPDGSVRWRDQAINLVTDVGLNYARGVTFLDGTKLTSWFGIFTGASPTPAAGDTHASHSGWTEFTAYAESTRQALTLATGATGVVSNTSNPIEITINANGSTIGGLGAVAGGSAPSTKGSTAGDVTLYSVSAFTTGNKSADADDVLEAVYTITFARP